LLQVTVDPDQVPNVNGVDPATAYQAVLTAQQRGFYTMSLWYDLGDPSSALAFLDQVAALPQRGLLFGDATGDGTFDPGDINHCIDWLVGKAPLPDPASQRFTASDVDGDRAINPGDLNLMIDKLLGKITQFPVEP
jgi:hypothetical protein